jgi:hypothetical protein
MIKAAVRRNCSIRDIVSRSAGQTRGGAKLHVVHQPQFFVEFTGAAAKLPAAIPFLASFSLP